MGKTVLMSVLKIVMGHVNLQMDHARIVKVHKFIAPKVIIDDILKDIFVCLFIHKNVMV